VAPASELPGGGVLLFPDYRVVAFYGRPGSDVLGVLGSGPPSAVVSQLRRQAEAYVGGGRRPVMLALHLIATVATTHPGNDGTYRLRMPAARVQEYLDAAREAGALLILDVQPGRADILPEIRYYEPFLTQADVGLALDPEWRAGPAEVPNGNVGTVDADEINSVAGYLTQLVRRHRLPQKLFMIHQFRDEMITNRDRIVEPSPELAVTIDVDGVGNRGLKLKKYHDLTRTLRPHRVGIKLYYRSERSDLLQPAEVLRLRPSPDIVIYQ
jgi:hypothetical protein